MPQPKSIAGTEPPRAAHPTPRAGWLARMIPPLAFDEPLETQFRSWYREQTRSRIRSVIWLPVLGLLALALTGGPFDHLRDALFGSGNQQTVDRPRFVVIAPSCFALLLVTYTGLYERWFELTAQAIAPLHSMCFVAMDL